MGKFKSKEVVHRSKNGESEISKSLYRQYISLFPNNHLDIENLIKEDLLNSLITQFAGGVRPDELEHEYVYDFEYSLHYNMDNPYLYQKVYTLDWR